MSKMLKKVQRNQERIWPVEKFLTHVEFYFIEIVVSYNKQRHCFKIRAKRHSLQSAHQTTKNVSVGNWEDPNYMKEFLPRGKKYYCKETGNNESSNLPNY